MRGLGFGALALVGLGALALGGWWLLGERAPDGPDLVLEGPEAEAGRLSEYRGAPVVLHLWATWCEPCRDELPALLAFADRVTPRRDEGAAGWVVLAAAVDDTFDAVARFGPARRGDALHHAVVRTALGPASRHFAVAALPVTLLLDAEGRVIARWDGPQDWSSPAMVQAIEAALGAGGSTR